MISKFPETLMELIKNSYAEETMNSYYAISVFVYKF